jgi:long-chain fatty acid transport protein
MITHGRTVVYVVAAIAYAGMALADGFRNPPEGAANLGRGGARLAYGDDPSTVSHNPANLMDLKKDTVMPTVTIGYSSKDYTSPYGRSEQSKDPWTVLPAVYASMPVQDGAFVAGLGVSVPYGQASRWDENGLLKFMAAYSAEMMTVNANPTLATRIGENVCVGAGVNVMWSSLEFRQSFPWLPPPAGLMGPSSRLVFDGDGYAFGANAGVTWMITKNQRLAAAYRSPMSVDYEGDFTMENAPPAGLPPGITPTSDFKTTVDFPTVVGLGYGLQATETLRVMADVEWIEHSRNQSLDIDIANNNALLLAALGTRSLPQNWDDTWTVGVGADWNFEPNWVLRGGWTYLPSPVPEETLMPSLAESDKNIFAAGVGFHKNGHALDVAYAYNLCDDRKVDAAQNPVKGEYEFDAHLAEISYTYSF